MIQLPIIAGLRRAMRRHQGIPPARADRLSTWRLLAGELSWLVQRIGRVLRGRS